MHEPLYRQAFDAAALMRNHPPQFQHPHKSALCEWAYPAGRSPQGEVEVSQWPHNLPAAMSLPADLSVKLRHGYFDYKPLGSAPTSVEWHLNFADPRLFVAYGSRLFAQDEMQVAEHPILGSVREALSAMRLSVRTSEGTQATPILIWNAERRLAIATDANASAGRPYGLYGNRFAVSPIDVVRRATLQLEPSTFTNLIAIAAPSGGDGDYSPSEIEFILATAYTGFSAAARESVVKAGPAANTVIHTGFWGCGAFGGNRKLMIALQAIAARAARISHLVVHTGNADGASDAQRGLDVADSIALRCGPDCKTKSLVAQFEMLGYQWGVSDGN